MISNKHDSIAQTLEQRIKDKQYSKALPRALDLAQEFSVNFKTVNKAIKQLVDKGLLYRKSGIGTFIAEHSQRVEDTLIEVLFVGSNEASTHPFYNNMWQGILDALEDSGYKVVLTMIKENVRTGGINKIHADFTPSAGKILIGTNNTAQINLLKKEKTPFVLLGSKTNDAEICCIYTSTSQAITSAVDYVRKQKIKDIAYIGITQDDGEHLIDLEKFHAYISAIQKKGTINSDLIVHTPPLLGYGKQSMQHILQKKIPGAVFVAYDHLLPDVYDVISEAGLTIPDDIQVIGIDNLDLHLSPKPTSIAIDRYTMGLKAAQVLLHSIRNPHISHESICIASAHFDPTIGGSVKHPTITT